MLQILYGWKGVPQEGDAPTLWVHVPQETYRNQYVHWETTNPYEGEVHENVDSYDTVTTVTLNGEHFMKTSTHVHVCRDCGRRSDKDWA